ncbi:MAG: phytanoyl-CoA dioxygenase family protein [Lentisphaeria bacterium]|nr:phytanoyl-CoA dioxygenase family protein [Lentisphaeria bacterium]NQZ70368.1 phytanoyl-CoA dioxygenase family protein [Lentisphaeria bacterium]
MELGELVESNDIINDQAAIRERLDEDGYLFFRNVLDTDKLAAMRLEIFTILQKRGWLVEGTDPMDGIANIDAQCTEGDAAYAKVYHEMYCLESFHRSGHYPEMLSILEKIIDGPVLPHPAKITRMWFPKYTKHTTPRHQDFVHFQGCLDTYTCWSPVGDCPIELGGLAVQKGSHKVGKVVDHHYSLGAGGLNVYPEDSEGDWLTTNYKSGDTLIFAALMVHQALPNVTEDRLRISLDNRYVSANRPIAEQMLLPHLEAHDGFTWEQVYKDWQTDDLQYYWKELRLDVIDMDMQWKNSAFDEELKLAKSGNGDAQYSLARTVRLDPQSEFGKRASQLLEEIS